MIKADLVIHLPEDTCKHLDTISEYPLRIKHLILQALPQKNETFDIQGITGIGKAFFSHNDEPSWTLVVREIKHTYDTDEAEHYIYIHAELNLDSYYA